MKNVNQILSGKERPILFSAPMVRAILDGRKTVTRREIKPSMRGFDVSFELHQQEDGSWRPMHTFDESCMDDQGAEHPIACPYGQPGDRLWVRESWWQAGDWQATYPEDDTGAWFGSRRVVYSSDGTPPNEPNTSYPSGLRNGAYSAAAPNKIWRHRPSIHMPRWACRILLEITDVRVERLQDISREQCIAEGPQCPVADHLARAWHVQFRDLWQSTGGNWDANPWVWCVSFRRVEQ